jgi:hypothetical protein
VVRTGPAPAGLGAVAGIARVGSLATSSAAAGIAGASGDPAALAGPTASVPGLGPGDFFLGAMEAIINANGPAP